MAGSPVGETVRDLLHALEPQQANEKTKQEETAAGQPEDNEPRMGLREDAAAHQEDEAPSLRIERHAHWKHAMMQHKRAWRPEEWWNAARQARIKL